MTNTLTQSPTKGLEIVSSSDSQRSATWDGHTIGMIQASPSLGVKWEYVRYSAYPKTFVGTYDECVAQAEKDYAEQNTPPQADVCLAEATAIAA